MNVIRPFLKCRSQYSVNSWLESQSGHSNRNCCSYLQKFRNLCNIFLSRHVRIQFLEILDNFVCRWWLTKFFSSFIIFLSSDAVHHSNDGFYVHIYIILITSILMYCCAIWSPHIPSNIDEIETVQYNLLELIVYGESIYRSKI